MRFTVIAGLTLSVWAATEVHLRAAETNSTVVHHHFVGLRALTDRTDAPSLRAILALPESQRLLGEVTRKLGGSLPGWFGVEAPDATNEAAALGPVVQSILKAESVVEVCAEADADHVTSWALAARLEPAEASHAARELGRVLAGLFGGQPPEADSKAWQYAGTDGKGDARYEEADGWFLLGFGSGAFKGVRDRLGTLGNPDSASTNDLVRVTWDLRRLASLLDWPTQPPGPIDQWPMAEVTMETRNQHLKTTARMVFPKPLDLEITPWKIPAKLMRDPIVGFTAVQNADVWLKRLATFADAELEEWPRQLFFWSLADYPYQQYVASPATNPTQVLAATAQPLAVGLMSVSAWRGEQFGLRITNQATRVELLVPGLPFFAPYLEADGTGADGIVRGGLFPLASQGDPAPAELLNQVEGRTNLVWYDWETSWHMVVTNPPGSSLPRLSTNLFGRPIQWMRLAQWSSAARRGPAGIPVIPGGAWVQSAVPYLGNTVTELVQTGPAELTLTRQSEVGWTGLELLALLRWMENPGFPGWTDLPPPTDRERIPTPGRLLPKN